MPKPKSKAKPKKVGRPPKWATPDDLQAAFDAYFEATPQNKYRITALALAVNLTREGLNEYSNKPEFSDVVKKAKERVADSYEDDLRGRYYPGAIFALKNMGWSDRQEIDVPGEITIRVVYGKAGSPSPPPGTSPETD